MKKILCLLFITALIAQICAMPGDKGADKKGADAKDKAAGEAKKAKDKADKIKDKAEGAAKDTEKEAKNEADDADKDVKKGVKDGEDEVKKAIPHKSKGGHKKPGVFESAAKRGEGIVDGFASEFDSVIGF